MNNILKVLAVADPAIYVYNDRKYNVISKYTEMHNTRIEFDIIPWNDYYGTMMKSFAGEGDYDIVMIAGHLWLKDFVEKGYLSPVKYPTDCDYDTMDILPVIRNEMDVGGQTYLYPSFCDGHMVLYRKSIVEKLLGTLPGKSISTDELIYMVKRCSGYNKMHGIVMKAHPSEIFLDFLPYLRNEGVDAFNSMSCAPSFNNEDGRCALEKYIGLRAFAPSDTDTYGNDEVKKAFQTRKAVFAVTWGGQLGTVLGNECEDIDDIGFAALKTSWNVTWSFGINRCSDRQNEANEFLHYLTSKEVDRIVGAFAGSPVRRSTYEIDNKKYKWYPIHLEMIKELAYPLPKMDNAGEKLGVLYKVITEAFNARITINEALEEAEKEILALDRRE